MGAHLRTFALFALLTGIFVFFGYVIGTVWLGDWVGAVVTFLLLAGAANPVPYFARGRDLVHGPDVRLEHAARRRLARPQRQRNHRDPRPRRHAPRAARRPACPARDLKEPRIQGGLQRREDGGAASRTRLGPRKAGNREPASAPDLRKPGLAEPVHRESVLWRSARADVQHPPAHP